MRELWHSCPALVCEEDSIFSPWKISQSSPGEEWGGLRSPEISPGVSGFRETLSPACKAVSYANVLTVSCAGRCAGMPELWRFTPSRLGEPGRWRETAQKLRASRQLRYQSGLRAGQRNHSPYLQQRWIQAGREMLTNLSKSGEACPGLERSPRGPVHSWWHSQLVQHSCPPGSCLPSIVSTSPLRLLHTSVNDISKFITKIMGSRGLLNGDPHLSLCDGVCAPSQGSPARDEGPCPPGDGWDSVTHKALACPQPG